MASTKQQAEEINWDSINQDAQDAMALQLPRVIWRHGKQAMKPFGDRDLNYIGGFFFSYEAAGQSAVIDLWTESAFQGDRDEVRGLGAPVADIALVRMRRRWFREGDGRTEFRSWNNYEPGFRGQMQYVGFIKGYEHPVAFSFKGLLGQRIEAVLREHMAKVVSLVNRTAPKGIGLPPYALWVRVKSGKHEKVGQGREQSEVTMPEIVLPKDIDVAFARSRFVGNALLQDMQSLYLEAADWAREWDYAAQPVDAKRLAFEAQRTPVAPEGEPADQQEWDDHKADDIPF